MSPPDDDLSIKDEVEVYRRIPPAHWKRVGDDEFEVREGAFKNFPNPEMLRMSVDLGDTLAAAGKDPAAMLEGHVGYGLMSLTVRFLRHEVDQRLERSPLLENPFHGDVYGEKPAAMKKLMAKQAVWVVHPS